MLNVGATYSIEMNTAAMLNKVEYRFMNPRDVSTLSFTGKKEFQINQDLIVYQMIIP